MESDWQVLARIQSSYIARGFSKSWRRLVDKMPEQRFSTLHFLERMLMAWKRTSWRNDELENVKAIHDVYRLGFSVVVVVVLYVRLLSRVIYSLVYLLICFLIAVENVLSLLETVPVYTLESILYAFRVSIFYTAEHFIAVLFILSYISVIYRDDLSEMKEVFLRFAGLWYTPQIIDSQPAKSEHSRCIICLENRKEVALQPCGHAQFCKTCTRRLTSTSKQCPVCRKDIRQTMNIYI